MAQNLLRKTLAVFGLGGTTDDFEEFGSTAASATNYTKDIEIIQGLAAWGTGWRAALVTSKAPVLQDMNAVMYVHSYESAYVFQEGIPEWDAGTTYNLGSVVKAPYNGSTDNAQFFASLSDSNLNQALPTAPASNSEWQYLSGMVGANFAIGSSLAFPATKGIIGIVSGSDPTSGQVGYANQAFQGATNFAATGVWGDLTSISIPAGNWDVYTSITGLQNGSTCTEIQCGLGPTSGNNAPNPGPPLGQASGAGPNGFLSTISVLTHINLTSTTTYYLKYLAQYSAGTPQAEGVIKILRTS